MVSQEVGSGMPRWMIPGVWESVFYLEARVESARVADPKHWHMADKNIGAFGISQGALTHLKKIPTRR